MHDFSDLALVREYVRVNSETAFAELVDRHIALVYSAAFRHAGIAAHAEEITQAVFIILARKAAGLRPDTILAGWLCETTRLTALSFMRGEHRRQRREQEAYMQSTLRESTDETVWNQLSPLLDEALSRLGRKERDAVVLRYFKDQNLREVAGMLNINEPAAQKRVNRALEKLRKFFTKRGVTLSSAAITGAISSNSVQAAPAGLAKTISIVAVAKGAAASASTLTLINGALKTMAWTKMKTAAVVGISVLLAAGTTTVTLKKIQEHRTYSWEEVSEITPANTWDILTTNPQQVLIKPAKPRDWGPGGGVGSSNDWMSVGLWQTAGSIVDEAYFADPLRTVFLTKAPDGKFDYIANLPHGSINALQEEIKRKFGLVGKKELWETDVLVLKLSKPEVQGFKPANSLKPSMNITAKGYASRQAGRVIDGTHTVTWFDATLKESLQGWIERQFQLPIIDETGLTNRYDFSFRYPLFTDNNSETHKQLTKEALLHQLGLELVPSREPIEMLVVEKVK